ncbi:hypothetical protein RJ641_004254 [Dillenia turbinata]|uniref:Uncharacterized protein n=1 Tax=Dillenia turbinata TaxID=194707 RepID=A0AAN8V9M3_9MAGN
MAGAQFAVVSLLRPSSLRQNFTTTTSIKTQPTISSLSTQFPSKPKKRKNHLRPKLLKTLTKPYPKPPTEFAEQTAPDQFQLLQEECSSVTVEQPIEEVTNTIAADTEKLNGGVWGISSRSVFQFAMGLIGAFVFQTLCAVWVFGSAEFDEKEQNLDKKSESGFLSMKKKGKVEFLFKNNGNFEVLNGNVYSGMPEIEEKIAEIQAMAREARKIDAEKSKGEREAGEIDVDEDGGDNVEMENSKERTGIQKEVDERLVRLRRSLNSPRQNLPTSAVNYLKKSGKGEDRIVGDSWDVKEAYRELMFKKKPKFRSISTNQRPDPEGFPGSKDDGEKKDGGNVLINEQQADLPVGDNKEIVFTQSEEDAGKKSALEGSNVMQTLDGKQEEEASRKEVGSENTKSKSGVVQGTSDTIPSIEAVKLKASGMMIMGNSRSVAKGFQGSSKESGKHASVRSKRNSKKREVVQETSAGKALKRQSKVETDLWWLNLPYVLAVFMRRGSDDEGPGGLYTLKTFCQTGDQIASSYTVTFQDRGDATNFCYLLQSFFEDLGDFSAEIVPMSIRELDEAVTSHTMNVIVVKKGQIKLYAGQPLEEVEMALRSLLPQNQSTKTPF